MRAPRGTSLLLDVSPDLQDWLSSLSRELNVADQSFREPGGNPEGRQFSVLLALMIVRGHLHKLPGLPTGPIDALTLAYEALCSGSSHSLLSNYDKKRGGRRLTQAQKEVQGRAIAMLEMLLEAGWREQDAVEIATKALVASGVKGTRRKAPLTSKGLRTWRTNANSGDSEAIRNLAARWRLMMKSTFEYATSREWPPSKGEAARLVSKTPESPTFLDLVASASN